MDEPNDRDPERSSFRSLVLGNVINVPFSFFRNERTKPYERILNETNYGKFASFSYYLIVLGNVLTISLLFFQIRTGFGFRTEPNLADSDQIQIKFARSGSDSVRIGSVN